ncbi:MAG TPA: hypothetical protein VI758_09440, partial [Bacteroidota bacterium]
FAAFVMLVPLAATSPNRVARWLGGRRWKNLHRLIYVCASLGVVHYLWLVKADAQRPLIYGAIVAALLVFRLWTFIARKNSQSRSNHPRSIASDGPSAVQTLRNG